MVFRRRPRPQWFVYFPTRTGWVQRSTGVTDKATAQAMERMLLALGPRGKRDWELLEAVLADAITLGALYDAWQRDDLDGPRARLADVDLAGHLGSFAGADAEIERLDNADKLLGHLSLMRPNLTDLGEWGNTRDREMMEPKVRRISRATLTPQ